MTTDANSNRQSDSQLDTEASQPNSEDKATLETSFDDGLLTESDSIADKHLHSDYIFPPPQQVDPDGFGLIAIGGDLKPQTLLSAYSQGLFPWFNEDEPIAWWSPQPRCILNPSTFTPSKSLKRLGKSSHWRWSVNTAFTDVIHACSLPRDYTEDTWIHDRMIDAYTQLHHLGYAHSIEVWEDSMLIGGLYGLKIGQIYFGESMFHRQSNASKIAFWALTNFCQHTQVKLIDCQLPNGHLQRLGATTTPRDTFLATLSALIARRSLDWQHFSHQQFMVNALHTTIPPDRDISSVNI